MKTSLHSHVLSIGLPVVLWYGMGTDGHGDMVCQGDIAWSRGYGVVTVVWKGHGWSQWNSMVIYSHGNMVWSGWYGMATVIRYGHGWSRWYGIVTVLVWPRSKGRVTVLWYFHDAIVWSRWCGMVVTWRNKVHLSTSTSFEPIIKRCLRVDNIFGKEELVVPFILYPLRHSSPFTWRTFPSTQWKDILHRSRGTFYLYLSSYLRCLQSSAFPCY